MGKEKLIESKIITLRLQGMTESEIMKHIKDEGEDILLYMDKIVHICNYLSVEKREDEEYVIKSSEELDDMIFILKKQGLLYEEIADKLKQMGVIITEEVIINKCIEICSKKRIRMPKPKKQPQIKSSKKEKYPQEVLDTIFDLREQHFTYDDISQQLEDIYGIIISSDTVRNKCKQIYSEKGLEVPKSKHKFIYDQFDDKIFKLREQGASYSRIAMEMQLEGISYCEKLISKRCKRIYAEKGMEEPKSKKIKKSEMVNNLIFDLIQNGLSYIEITKQLQDKGIVFTENQICNKCRKICKEKGIEIPASLRLERIPEDRVFKLRQQKLSPEKIANIFAEEGIVVSAQTIRNKSKKIYKKKNMAEPKLQGGRKRKNGRSKHYITEMNDTALIKIFKKIQIRKKATDEQLRKLAEYYGIDYTRLLKEMER